MELLILLWLVCGLAGVFIMQGKGQSGCLGLILGITLGVIGLIVCALWPAKK